MTDKTNDIWNDDDGEEEQVRRQRRSHCVRHFFLFFLTLVVVLGVVLVAAWRDGTGFDVLRRYLTYGGHASEESTIRYDASADNRFALVGEDLVVLSGTMLRVLDQSGEEVWSTAVSMAAPAISTGGGYAVAYDVGGTELYVVGPEGERMSLTAAEEEPFISATLNAEGWLTVTAERKGYKGGVSVYDAGGDLVFDFNSSQRFVSDAYVTDDCETLAAVTLGQEESVFVSSVVLYDLTETDPKASYDIVDGLVIGIGEQDSQIVTVSDTSLSYASEKGELEASYGYDGSYLRGYDFSGDGFTALLLNRYQAGSVGRLVTVGPDGEEIASLDVNEEVLDISAAGRYLAVLYTDALVIYNKDLQTYSTLSGTEHAREVLVRSDGSALLIGSEQAHLFLP